MFDVDENGDLTYVPDESDPVDDAPDGTLYDPGPADTETDPSAPLETDPAPEDPVADEGTGEEITADPVADDPLEVTPPPLTGSGNMVYVPFAVPAEDSEVSLTTSGDVYIYPDGPEAEPLAEARSAYTANVLGLPSSSSLEYLRDVAAGYPSWYSYMAFKTDSNYSQSMALWIGPKAVKASGQNRIDFTDGVDCIEVAYIRSGSTNYYQYKSAHYGSYSIAYDSDVFLYTDVVDGYAQLVPEESLHLPVILVAAFVLALVLMIFRGGSKS